MNEPENQRRYLPQGGGETARPWESKPGRERGRRGPAHAVSDDQGETFCNLGPDGEILFVNDVFCRVFGKRRSQLVGKSWETLVETKDWESLKSRLAGLTPDDPVVVVESRVRQAKGATRWMQFVNRGWFDEGGRLEEVRVVGRDIQERVAMEQALKESNERWKFAIEGSGDGVWDWEVPTGRVSYSDRWKTMLGYEPGEVDATVDDWQMRVHPEDLPATRSALMAHFDGIKESYAQEFRMRCKDGSWKWILARGRVISREPDGKPRRVIGTHTDISAAKEAKEREASNLRLVAEGAPCGAVLEAIVRSVEAEHPEMLCKVMVVEEETGTLRLMAAPSLPVAYVSLYDGRKAGEGEVSCEGAIRFGKRVVTADIQKDEGWRGQRTRAMKEGLAACWAEPILSRTGKVLGAFACYYRKARLATWQETGTVMNAVSLAAVAIEREKEEAALRDSERKFRAVFEQAAVGVTVAETATGRFLDVNQKLCEIYGETREGLMGSTFMEFTHPLDLEEDLGLMRQLIEGKIPRFTMEKRNVRRDGTVFWVNLNVSPLWHPGEKPQRHVGIVHDITARKVAEENYRRELEYNRALVSNTSVYMAAMDAQGRFIHVNNAFLTGLGYKEEEIINRTPWEIGLMDEQETARSMGRFQNLLSGLENLPVEARLKARSGEWRVVELRGALTRKADGSADRVIISGTDLTERNRLQQEVLNIVEREQARLGHDLHDGVGQTMTGIVAMIEALESEAPEALKEDAGRIRKLIQSAVAEMRHMSHGLSPTSVKYRGLSGALQLLAETVRLNHRKECECDLDAGIEMPDEEVQTHLFRIAQEAVNNALRHGKPKLIRIGLRHAGEGECVLRIEDDGKGMPKRKGRARPKASPANGQGIGLRVMEYRANLAGASLSVRPRPGGGVVVECKWRWGKKKNGRGATLFR